MRLKFFAVAVRGKGTGFIFDFRKKKINPVPFHAEEENKPGTFSKTGRAICRMCCIVRLNRQPQPAIQIRDHPCI